MAFARSFSRRTQGSGPQPISHLMQLALARPELISLAAGFVDQATLPISQTSQAVDALLRDEARARAALQYGTNMGNPALRRALLERFCALEMPGSTSSLSIDQFLLTAGSNQLLHLVAEVLFDPDDLVLCPAPCYFVYLGLLSSLGVRSAGIEIDDSGMIPEALEEELERRHDVGELDRVKAIYVTSYFDNPSTVSLPAERRAKIVEIAKRWSRDTKIYVIDDTAYRELRYGVDDLPSLRSFDEEADTVIVADTFSKSFSPGIRVGWGILPAELVAPVASLKANIDFGSPHFNQHLMAEVLHQGLFESHVASLRENYQTKLSAMLSALHEHLSGVPGVRWVAPHGGLYVWLQLPDRMDAGPDGSLMARALDEGVLYVPGEYCYPSEGARARKDRIRLSFGVQTVDNIRRGIAGLASAIRSVGSA